MRSDTHRHKYSQQTKAHTRTSTQMPHQEDVQAFGGTSIYAYRYTHTTTCELWHVQASNDTNEQTYGQAGASAYRFTTVKAYERSHKHIGTKTNGTKNQTKI